MKIRVITIEREYGCGGGAIAHKVADRLDWKLWDQLLTCEIARLAKCERAEVETREERVDPLYYRLLKSVMRGSFEGSLNLHRLHCLDADNILRITKQVTQAAAASGNCVIVGRGSQHHLRDRDDTLRIFLYASREFKVQRLKADGIAEAEAEELVDSVDAERADFIEKYFHMEWPNRSVYHAMLNTEHGDETVTEMVLSLKERIEKAPHDSLPLRA
jgi:CMP/dCMP kinase